MRLPCSRSSCHSFRRTSSVLPLAHRLTTACTRKRTGPEACRPTLSAHCTRKRTGPEACRLQSKEKEMEHRPSGLCSVGTDPEACRYLLLVRLLQFIRHEIALRRSGASHGAEAIADEGKAFPISKVARCYRRSPGIPAPSWTHRRLHSALHAITFHTIIRRSNCRAHSTMQEPLAAEVFVMAIPVS